LLILLFLIITRLDEFSLKLLEWEQSHLGLEIVQSQFVGGGCCLATSANQCFKKGDLIAQYRGRFLLLKRSEIDQLFHPMFMGCHERLIELGPVMQPVVAKHHCCPLTFNDVSKVFPHLFCFFVPFKSTAVNHFLFF
jgi:hypothetical protein